MSRNRPTAPSPRTPSLLVAIPHPILGTPRLTTMPVDRVLRLTLEVVLGVDRRSLGLDPFDGRRVIVQLIQFVIVRDFHISNIVD